MSSKASLNDVASNFTGLAMPISLPQTTIPEDQSRNPVPPEGSSKAKPTQIACTLCRRRKIKCDGGMPSCGRCTKLNSECTYHENRRKSGPRRGYVKGLETRLAQVEVLLKQQEMVESESSAVPVMEPDKPADVDIFQDLGLEAKFVSNEQTFGDLEQGLEFTQSTQGIDVFYQLNAGTNSSAFLHEEFSWAMIELGVEEPLPPQETIDELTQIYFTKVHPSVPVIHKYRFLASMNLSGNAKPSISLRYAMWSLAASITESYKSLHSHFHGRARKYAEADERAGRQKFINIRHAQAWILIGIYEFKMMMFPNAWLTTGRATRLTQMLGLHRLDGLGLDVKQSLPTPTDVSEKEERRRTFWMAFCMDRYAGVGTGWPLIVDERDILTYLPSSEEAYEERNEVVGISLPEAMNPTNAASLSSFAGVVVVASLSGRILQHLHRPHPEGNGGNTNTEFWRTHREIDNTLLNMSLYLPRHLRLPAGSSNPNTIFLNMSLQAAVICLHQAAIFKGDKLLNPGEVVAESKARCLAAATEISLIMKRIAHMDLSMLNVYTPFSLYVSARIFAQVSKSQAHNDDDSISSLRFLLSALMALKDANPLAESYLIQLDLEGIGLAALQENARLFSQLEKGVAAITIQEPSDESEWITFVSPLVRIVEQTDESASSPSISQPFGETSSSVSNHDNELKGKGPMSSGSIETDTSVHMLGGFDGTEPSTGEEMWSYDKSVLQTDLFDSLMDFGDNR